MPHTERPMSRIGKSIYPVRVFGYWCAVAEVLLSVYFFERAFPPQALIFTVAMLLYPHLAYLAYQKRGGRRAYEFDNLTLDMFWIGWIVALLRFSPITALPFAISNSATNFSTGGWRLFLRGLGAFAAGTLVFGGLNGFVVSLDYNLVMLVPSSVYMTLSLHYIAILSFTRGEKILLSKQEIEQQHQALARSMQELREAQAHLIQSEKTAVMGKLVANIAHEINTPLGAIHSSANNIDTDLDFFAQYLPQIFQLFNKEQIESFCALVGTALEQKELGSSKEERRIRRTLEEELTALGVPDAYELAYDLTNAGIYELKPAFLPLFQMEAAAFALKLAYSLANQKRGAQNIRLAVAKASKVVFALKSFAQKTQSTVKEVRQVQDGMETILSLYKSQLRQGVELTRDYREVPAIACYPEELNQVWTNLIHNALQAMAYRGALRIGIVQGAGKIIVSVADTGKGMSAEAQARAFEPFFTTQPTGEGSGLGLHIAQQIVEKHNGRIYFESIPQQGTTFFVELPIQ